jgi:multiple sugar transport system permease protein
LKGYAFISPWLLGFAFFTAVPVGLSFYYSLCDYSLLQPPAYIGLDNYRELARDPVFWQSLFNTLLYAALALPVGLVIALAIALLLNADIRGKTLYRTFMFLPSLVPAVASAMIWLWLYNPKLGLINIAINAVGRWVNPLLTPVNAALRAVGSPPIDISGPGWLTNTPWAMIALVLMSFWGLGNTIVIYLAGLQDVPKDLYEAAEIDGATGWKKLIHVTIPCLSPVIFFNVIMALIGTFQIFGAPYIMTTGGPARSTYFYTMYVYDNAFEFLKMGYASSLAWVQLLIILALTGIAFWTSRRWVHYQGK